MKSMLVVLFAAAALSACAGLDITPISHDKVQDAHDGKATLHGYVVYEPMVLIEIGCTPAENETSCNPGNSNLCEVGKPFAVPDLASPFLVNSRTGLGSAGTNITITDGWQLGTIQNNSNNTQLLDLAKTAVQTLNANMLGKGKPAPGRCYSTLYRLEVDDNNTVILHRITFGTP